MSQSNKDFLVELGTEELPPTALKSLSDAFTTGVEAGLKEAGLSHGNVVSYAAPRRLAITIEALQCEDSVPMSSRSAALFLRFNLGPTLVDSEPAGDEVEIFGNLTL